MFSLKCSLLLLGLLTESLDHTRLMGAPTKVHLMFLSSTYRLTELHYTYGNATLSADYVGYLYFQNHWVTPYKWVSNPKDSLCWLALPRESLGYTTLIGVQPQVQPMIVRPTYRSTRSHYTFGCPTYSSAYVCKLYVQNHWVTLHLWKRHLKCSLCWLPLRRESPGYTSVIGAPP